MKLLEVRVRLEVGVGLRDGKQVLQRTGEEAVGLHLAFGRRRVHDGGASLGNLLERAAFVGSIAFDGLDEVRDEVETALQLHVDLRPGVIHHVAELDEVVV